MKPSHALVGQKKYNHLQQKMCYIRKNTTINNINTSGPEFFSGILSQATEKICTSGPEFFSGILHHMEKRQEKMGQKYLVYF